MKRKTLPSSQRFGKQLSGSHPQRRARHSLSLFPSLCLTLSHSLSVSLSHSLSLSLSFTLTHTHTLTHFLHSAEGGVHHALTENFDVRTDTIKSPNNQNNMHTYRSSFFCVESWSHSVIAASQRRQADCTIICEPLSGQLKNRDSEWSRFKNTPNHSLQSWDYSPILVICTRGDNS